MDNEKIVNSIKSLCKEKSITVGQLEKTVGLSQGLVSKWKDKTPSLDKIIDIADFFHVSIDKVVGRNQLVSDEFISKLIQMTENKELIWYSYDECESDDDPKQFFDVLVDPNEYKFDEDYEQYKKTHKETSYYAKFGNGYFSIYAAHINMKITEPYELKIFIQPDNLSELVPQEYSSEELLPLWIKVLNSLSIDTPDEVKAAELKNCILKNKNPYDEFTNRFMNSDFEVYDKIKEVLSPEIQETLKLLESESFKSMQKLLKNKDFIQSVQNAQKAQDLVIGNNKKKK